MGDLITPAAAPELRYAVVPIRDVVFRDAQATGDGSWLIEGYAAVFDQETVLYDGSFFRVKESIAPGAFSAVLARTALPAGDPNRTLVHLNYVHDMQAAVASTDAPGPIGRLELAQDDVGLRFTARVDREDPDAQRMAVKMRRGVANQASFAFTLERWTATTTDLADGREEDDRRILEVRNLFDVCVCPQGAYAQTVSTLRSLAAAIGRSPEGEGHPRRSDPEGAPAVAEQNARGGGDDTRAKRLAAARARARASLSLMSEEDA